MTYEELIHDLQKLSWEEEIYREYYYMEKTPENIEKFLEKYKDYEIIYTKL